MTHMIRRLSLSLLFAALLCVGGLQINSAQNNSANPADATPKRKLGLVNEYTIKQGTMTAYLEWVQKESRPLFVKAGIKERYVFTNVYDTDRNVVTTIEMHDSFAAIQARNEAFTKNNSQESRDAWNAKSREFIVGARTYIVETLPELTWVNPKLKGPTPYYQVTERVIAPFRGHEYEAYLKNDWLPLVKKADTNGALTSRFLFGGEQYHYFIFNPVAELTDFDKPSKVTQVASGADALNKMRQKLVGVVQRSEVRVLRLRPEISIIPTPNTAAK